MSGCLSCLPRRGGHYEMWPRWVLIDPFSPESGTAWARERPSAGHGGPRLAGGLAVKSGESRGTRGSRVRVRVSGFPSRGGSGQGSGPGLGQAGAPRARSGSGRFEAAAPASWARRGAGNLSAASAPWTQASPLCVRASPVLVGKLRQRWRALGRPDSIRAVPRGPLRGITKRSGSSVPTARRCPGFLQRRGCEERAAAIVNANPQPLRRRSASWFHQEPGLVPTTEVT